ncbi:hypothetical protein JOM56_003652 [Amanita muscaria]
MLSTSNIQRTYASRRNTPSQKRSLSSDDTSPVPQKRRRILTDNNHRSAKTPKPKQDGKQQKSLIQLHFCTDNTVLRTCPSCSLSYTKGVPEDEALHSAHCARIQRGMEWGREEERERVKADVREIEAGVRLKSGVKGRIICFRADVGGRTGSKVTTILQTVNLALSAPPLTPQVLRECKLYLFLVPYQPKSGASREKIVGCVVAQHIKSAMAIATSAVASEATTTGEAASLVTVDTGMGIFCYPEHLPTPMGIPRLFVASTHRRQGIASKLLTAAAKTFIHGYELDPRKGEVAFTQPTGDGNAIMLKWGGGGVRIYSG